MKTLFDLVSQLDKEVTTFKQGIWAPILWTPFGGSDERFMVAIAIKLGTSQKVLRIIDDPVLKAFYQSNGKKASNIIDFIVTVLDQELQSDKPITELRSFSENFIIGNVRNITAPNLTDAATQIIQMHSSIMTKERYLNMLNPSNFLNYEDWIKTVKTFCRNTLPNIGQFDQAFSIDRRNISVFFQSSNHKFVALSLQLNSDKQFSQLCMKARDANLLQLNHGVSRAITLIRKEANTEELIDRFQYEQKQMRAPSLDYTLFNNPLEVPYYLQRQSRSYY